MGLYDAFETDGEMEVNGVVLDYSDFRIRIAHAGGANKRFLTYGEVKLKPLNRAIQAGTVSNERARAIMADIYAETIILDWETRIGEEFKKGIEGRDGKLLPFNKENVKQTLLNLPKLADDIQEQAQSMANFRKERLEEEAKNS